MTPHFCSLLLEFTCEFPNAIFYIMKSPNTPSSIGDTNSLSSLLGRSSTTHHLRQLHARLIVLSLHHHQSLLSNLISLSFLFQSRSYAFTLFSCYPSTHLLNTLLHSLSQSPSLHSSAFPLYLLHLRRSTTSPNCFTFPSLFNMCTLAFSSLNLHRGIHSHVLKFGTHLDVYVGTALLDCYCKLGDIGSARRVFDEMPERSVVTYNSIILGLGKFGEVELARKVFEEMPARNILSWTCMIATYARNGYYCETLGLFDVMRLEGVRPSEYTLVSVLSACANLGALGLGRKVHGLLEDEGYVIDLFVCSSLIDMYSKCGMVGDALRVFDKIADKNVVVCSAMIMGLAINGRGLEAIGVYEEMKLKAIAPNDITFVGLLCACCHMGLVDEGREYFRRMSEEYSISPKLQHYTCMVDILGRSGHLEEAYQFIMNMPIAPDVVVWGSMLGGCKIHKKYELGKIAAKRILELDPRHSGSLVYQSSVFAQSGNLDGVKKVSRRMGTTGVKKTPGMSWIEFHNSVHQFFAGDMCHPEADEIYTKLDELAKLLEAEGYSPDLDSIRGDLEEEEKGRSSFYHSEKLAIAFGLIKYPEGSSIRIVKNLRICPDCHTVIKHISKIVRREIIVRDNNRFHHFKEGMCSCRDYW